MDKLEATVICGVALWIAVTLEFIMWHLGDIAMSLRALSGR
jgi:hypothetical protein